MRTLWIAGLGAVLIAGGATAQGVTTSPGTSLDRQGSALPSQAEQRLRGSTADQPPPILRPQEPRLSQDRLQTQQGMQSPTPGVRSQGGQQLPGALHAQDPEISRAQPGRLGQERAEPARQAPAARTQGPTPVPPGMHTQGGQQLPGALHAQDPEISRAQPQSERLRREQSEQPRQARQAPAARTQGARQSTPDRFGREDAPRRPEDRAYMGGGLILEDGRPVPMPGDPPGMASDFRGERVEQSTARGTGAEPRQQGMMGQDMMGQGMMGQDRPHQGMMDRGGMGATGTDRGAMHHGAGQPGSAGSARGALPGDQQGRAIGR